MEKIKGLIDAPFTPFYENGEVNYEPIEAYAKLLVKNGLKGVFINGSSGEGYMLTDEERMKLAERWVEVAPSGFKVIVHVGSTCVKASHKLAAHAQKIGAWGIGAMASPFPKVNRIEELVKYCEEIASGAPELPFYYYHIPAFNGAFLPMVELLKAVDGRIPNFAGIKYTYESLYEYNQCRLYKDGKFDMLHGQDETILPCLAMGGAQGGIGGTTNYNGKELTGILEAWAAGDLETARERQNFSQEVINVICRYRGNIVGGKRIMKLIGLDLGKNRTPFQNMTDAEETAMKAELEATHGVRVYILPFDVRDRKLAAASLESLPEEWKAIDVLVNNAGLVIGVDKEFEGNLDEWDIMIDTNIRGLLAMTRLVVPGMVERGRGHIINIGSIAGDAAYPGGSVYCATKAAVKALSDGLRIDLVDTPLRVTNIKPGMVETNFTVVRYRGDKEAADNFYKGIRPLTGDDIAETVYFAASAPAHIQIAEVLLMPTYQATGTISYKKKPE